MEKFDPDFALFGILTANLSSGLEIGKAEIAYTNQVSERLYGQMRGRTIVEIVSAVAGDDLDGARLVAQLGEGNSITVEGLLNDRFVKLHCTVVRYCDEGSCDTGRFVQAGIMDITESVVLKDLLYGTSEALKRAAWAADEDTGSHVVRINRYAGKLAGLMNLDRVFIDDISNYAQLHDIGKINVAEIIRLPRKLNDTELVEMRKHTIYGARMVEGLAGLAMAYDITLDHHEKWDGTGYPNGKKGQKISLAGRIVAIADVFDALVSKRPYKPAFSYEQALEIISNGDDRVMPGHFDPEIQRLFIDNYEDFVALHQEMGD